MYWQKFEKKLSLTDKLLENKCITAIQKKYMLKNQNFT